MDSIVISLGGSIVFSEDVNNTYFYKLINLLKKYCKKFKIYIVIGGGKTARDYIRLGRKLGMNEKKLDLVGIEITKINARIISNLIGISNKDIPDTTDEAKKIDKPIVVMGGTIPGHSTDMVGAELAEKTNSIKYIIATNVDGVYDKDPNIFSEAKQIKNISVHKLINNLGGIEWKTAGKNVVIDGPALMIIRKFKIKTLVLNGKKIDELEKAISNKPFCGTIITT